MDNDNENIKENAAAAVDVTRTSPAGSRRWLVAILAGVALTVAAWLALMFYPVASLWCAVAALALSVAGLRIGRGCLRDIGITSIVASGVLVLVHIIFTWGLDYTVNSL